MSIGHMFDLLAGGVYRLGIWMIGVHHDPTCRACDRAADRRFIKDMDELMEKGKCNDC